MVLLKQLQNTHTYTESNKLFSVTHLARVSLMRKMRLPLSAKVSPESFDWKVRLFDVVCCGRTQKEGMKQAIKHQQSGIRCYEER